MPVKRAVGGALVMALAGTASVLSPTPTVPGDALGILWADYCSRVEDDRCLAPSPSITPAPTSSPTPAPTPTPAASATPTPTSSPSPQPSATSSTSTTTAITSTLLASLPRSGAAYQAVVSAANSSTRPNLADQDSKGNTNALARAFLGRDVAADITATKASLPNVSRTLSLARELAPLPLVSSLAGRNDCPFYLQAINLTGLEGRDASSVRESARIDPTNWGSMSRAAVMAVAWACGDAALRAEAWDNLKRYLEGGSGFLYKSDQVSWGTWTIAPKGTVKSGVDLDGAIHDIYRGGDFPTIGSSGVNYTWEASQGNLTAAIFADMAGYPVWTTGDSALLRSVEWMYRTVGAPTGDDRWQPWVIERAYPVFSRTLETPTSPGKNFGFADWLYGVAP